jgi:predicted Zn-dependent protease
MDALPNEALVPLTLAKMYAKLDRPAEAIDQFYGAAILNSEYFDEVKLGVGTARAQQGRLAEATVNFESASRMSPKNTKLAEALVAMRRGAKTLAEASAAFDDAAGDVCGTPCQEVVDTNTYKICSVTWAEGCGDAVPPSQVRSRPWARGGACLRPDRSTCLDAS